MKPKKSKCRVCLKPRTKLIDLSDPLIRVSRLNIRLQTAFFNLTGIFISEIEPARHICASCVSKLRAAVEFQHEAKESHAEIGNQISAGTWDIKPELGIKIEQDDDDDECFDYVGLEDISDVKLESGPERSMSQGGRGFGDSELRKKSWYVRNDSKWVRRQLKMGQNLVCDHCKEEFELYKDLFHHMKRNHMEQRPFKCTWRECKRSFCNQKQLDKHVDRRHGTKVMSVCEECGINILKASMKEHLKTHRSDRPFLCPHEGCHSSFKDKNGLTQHLAGYHNQERKFVCNVCGNSYKMSSTLLKHIRVTHTFENCVQCNICLKWFPTPNQLQSHINQLHLNLRPISCELCGSSHKSQGKLNRHMQQMHTETYQMWREMGKLKCRNRSKMKPKQDAFLEQKEPFSGSTQM